MLLRNSEHKGSASYRAVAARARSFRGVDPEGYRAEFIKLTDLAAALNGLSRRGLDVVGAQPAVGALGLGVCRKHG